MGSEANQVNFGRKRVSPEEKTELVNSVFQRVAEKYDVMNDIMSFGLHRVLKRIALEYTGLRPGDSALDVAGGTGDVARLMRSVVSTNGLVTILDINESMIKVGRDRFLDAGMSDIQHVVGSAEQIPFPSDSFAAITVCFGIRNMTDQDGALSEMYRVLERQGNLVVLEFSQPPHTLLNQCFRTYQRLWPIFGQIIVGDSEPYSYLVESIEKHHSQEALKQLIEDAGFTDVSYENLLGGIVAIHRGKK